MSTAEFHAVVVAFLSRVDAKIASGMVQLSSIQAQLVDLRLYLEQLMDQDSILSPSQHAMVVAATNAAVPKWNDLRAQVLQISPDLGAPIEVCDWMHPVVCLEKAVGPLLTWALVGTAAYYGGKWVYSKWFKPTRANEARRLRGRKWPHYATD